MPLIPALRKQRQVETSEFQDNQGYREKPCLKKTKQNNSKELGHEIVQWTDHLPFKLGV